MWISTTPLRSVAMQSPLCSGKAAAGKLWLKKRLSERRGRRSCGRMSWARSDPMIGITRVKQSAKPGWKSSCKDALQAVRSLLNRVHYYRWDPRVLALPVAPDLARRFRMESNGFGLALCLDEILSYDREQFAELERRFTEVFPRITAIRLYPEMAYRAPVDNPIRVTMLEQVCWQGIILRVEGREVRWCPLPKSLMGCCSYWPIWRSSSCPNHQGVACRRAREWDTSEAASRRARDPAGTHSRAVTHASDSHDAFTLCPGSV